VAFCKRIMSLRRFYDAWRMIEDGTKQEDLPNTEAVRRVLEVKIERAKQGRVGG
jgi:hypothetical protein